MSHMQVLKQAWRLLWRCRALWVFGILLALTTFSWESSAWRSGGNDGGGNNQPPNFNFQLPPELQSLQVPGWNGERLIREVRSLRPDLPALLASGQSDADAGAKPDGITRLPKPYSLEEVLRAIAAMIAAAPTMLPTTILLSVPSPETVMLA
mgnify:CR=1 FL=1